MPLTQAAARHFEIARSVRLSVPWRSCLGYRHAGCLQLSHRRPPEMCGLQTRPRTDADPSRFVPPSNCHRQGAYRLAAPGRYLVSGASTGIPVDAACLQNVSWDKNAALGDNITSFSFVRYIYGTKVGRGYKNKELPVHLWGLHFAPDPEG